MDNKPRKKARRALPEWTSENYKQPSKEGTGFDNPAKYTVTHKPKVIVGGVKRPQPWTPETVLKTKW
jgi:hypothetical protein